MGRLLRQFYPSSTMQQIHRGMIPLFLRNSAGVVSYVFSISERIKKVNGYEMVNWVFFVMGKIGNMGYL